MKTRRRIGEHGRAHREKLAHSLPPGRPSPTCSAIQFTDDPGYTGHVHDADSGLVYMQQRYYDPEVGRFLSLDPVGVSPATGANFNRYWYANNNPYTFVDPDGRQACKIPGRPCDSSGMPISGSAPPKFVQWMQAAAQSAESSSPTLLTKEEVDARFEDPEFLNALYDALDSAHSERTLTPEWRNEFLQVAVRSEDGEYRFGRASPYGGEYEHDPQRGGITGRVPVRGAAALVISVPGRVRPETVRRGVLTQTYSQAARNVNAPVIVSHSGNWVGVRTIFYPSGEQRPWP